MAPNAALTLLNSACFDDPQAVVAWLDEGGGVDTERDGVTLLMVGAMGGQEAMVRMLLQRDASINLQDSRGSTALMGAAFHGHTTIVQALLDAKADTSLQNSLGWTALMTAAALNGDTTIVQALLNAKADASLQDNDGFTALMMAERKKHTATAQLLRQHAERPTAEAEARADVAATHLADAAPTPGLSGSRVHASSASRGDPSSTGVAAWRGASTQPRGGTRYWWRARRRLCC